MYLHSDLLPLKRDSNLFLARDVMGKLTIESSIRYPPFDSSRWVPEFIPPAKTFENLGQFESKQEALNHVKSLHPQFCIGTEDSWHLKREIRYDGQSLQHDNSHNFIEENRFPPIVKRQRRGWYLHPHPIHSLVRKMIKFSVIVLLICLMYLFIEPILSNYGLPSVGTQTVRFGLLDYPLLAFFVVPLLFAPIIMRVYGNFSDLRSQQKFLNADIENPIIHFHSKSYANKSLEVSIEFPFFSEQWDKINVGWQVGVLPPSRDALLSAHQLTTEMQPPPGLSTELPHHWEASLDDGTAGGEDAPMDSRLVSGGLFLRPMRISEKGGEDEWVAEKVMKLSPPPNVWPGTTCTDLIRIHWECIITFFRKDKAPLYYVQPLKVHYPEEKIHIEQIQIHDGRIELNNQDQSTT